MKNYQKNINNEIYQIKRLFLIYTPFQLFSVLNIIDSINNKSNIDVVYMHPNIRKYTDIIKDNYNIKIYEYEFFFSPITKSKKINIIHLAMIRKMLEWKKKILTVSNSKVKYDEIFIPSDAIECNVVFSHFYRINNKVKLNIFDDGMGTYQKGYLDPHKKNIYAKVSKLIFGNFFWEKIHKVYCYKPKLLDNALGTELEIYQMKMTNKVKEIIAIDGRNQYQKYHNKKMIYLDQGEISESLNKFFSISKKYFLTEEIIAKIHPRLKPNIPNKYASMDNSGKAFESVCANLNDDHIVIISSYSTACITPYILFNKYPYVIFLGALEGNRLDNVFESNYIKRIYEEYKKERLFIPKTFNELELNLKFVSDKINQKEV